MDSPNLGLEGLTCGKVHCAQDMSEMKCWHMGPYVISMDATWRHLASGDVEMTCVLHVEGWDYIVQSHVMESLTISTSKNIDPGTLLDLLMPIMSLVNLLMSLDSMMFVC